MCYGELTFSYAKRGQIKTLRSKTKCYIVLVLLAVLLHIPTALMGSRLIAHPEVPDCY